MAVAGLPANRAVAVVYLNFGRRLAAEPHRAAVAAAPVGDERAHVGRFIAWVARAAGGTRISASSPARRENARRKLWRARTGDWSGRWDSNPRPQPWQGCALPLSYARLRPAPCVAIVRVQRARTSAIPPYWRIVGARVLCASRCRAPFRVFAVSGPVLRGFAGDAPRLRRGWGSLGLRSSMRRIA